MRTFRWHLSGPHNLYFDLEEALWSLTGCFSLQRHCLSVLDLQVWTHPETGIVQQDAWQELACWACEGCPTDVKARPFCKAGESSRCSSLSCCQSLHSGTCISRACRAFSLLKTKRQGLSQVYRRNPKLVLHGMRVACPLFQYSTCPVRRTPQG